jgi:hypothetical protein
VTTDDACDACGDKGYLYDQGYGMADIPEDWVPVQACDACAIGRDMTDEQAALSAAEDRDDIDHRVYCAWFPGDYADPNEPDDDERGPGDWAIGPNMDEGDEHETRPLRLERHTVQPR